MMDTWDPLETAALVLWLPVLAATLLYAARRGEKFGGLTILYLAHFTLLYWVGTALESSPWIDVPTAAASRSGTTVAFAALLATAAGILLAVTIGRDSVGDSRLARKPDTGLLQKLALIGVGAAVLQRVPLVASLPGFTALASTLEPILYLVGGVVLANIRRTKTRMLLAGAILVGLPIFTIVTSGFLGKGAFGALLCFILGGVRLKRGLKSAVVLSVVGYLSLSLFVTYLRDRDATRSLVWGGASLETRATFVAGSLFDFEFFDPQNIDHVERVSRRLNQAHFVGYAKANLAAGRIEALGFSTISNGVLALVPRVVWPSKPIVAGSGDIVQNLTGLVFNENTSVGVGSVLEWYGSFEWWGVIGFHFVAGLVLVSLDRRIGWLCARQRPLEATRWYLCAVPIVLQIGGSLVELTVSMAAGFINGVAIQMLFGRRGPNASAPNSRPIGNNSWRESEKLNAARE